jgi:phosphoglycolate phosphatase-like HAD superfamily hydrolase
LTARFAVGGLAIDLDGTLLDTLPDIATPTTAPGRRGAGCPVLCVPYGYRGAGQVRDLDCDAIVTDLLHACSLITPNRS